jgi:hypothetical protein
MVAPRRYFWSLVLLVSACAQRSFGAAATNVCRSAFSENHFHASAIPGGIGVFGQLRILARQHKGPAELRPGLVDLLLNQHDHLGHVPSYYLLFGRWVSALTTVPSPDKPSLPSKRPVRLSRSLWLPQVLLLLLRFTFHPFLPCWRRRDFPSVFPLFFCPSPAAPNKNKNV